MVGKAFLTKLFVLENETVTPFSIIYVISEDCGVCSFVFIAYFFGSQRKEQVLSML